MLDEKIIKVAWGQGHIKCGDISKDSARYMTGYITKGMNNEKTKKTIKWLNGRYPEFMRSSKQNGGIGSIAIDNIAKKLLKCRHKFEIPHVLQHGKAKYPLGRYLRLRLATKLGRANEIDSMFHDYQDELFDTHSVQGTLYVDSIMEESYQDIRKMERKHKIIKTRRPI